MKIILVPALAGFIFTCGAGLVAAEPARAIVVAQATPTMRLTKEQDRMRDQECTNKANAKHLHGQERFKFREECKAAWKPRI